MQFNTDNMIQNTQIITHQDLQFKGGIAELVIALAYMICNILFIMILKPDRVMDPL